MSIKTYQSINKNIYIYSPSLYSKSTLSFYFCLTNLEIKLTLEIITRQVKFINHKSLFFFESEIAINTRSIIQDIFKNINVLRILFLFFFLILFINFIYNFESLK